MILSLLTEHFYIGELVFFLLACGGTWLTGRAVARIWQGPGTFLVYSLGLAAGVRFLHYALYGGPFLSLPHYLSDLVILAIIGVFAHRYTRTKQMINQYPWLYERASPLSWKSKA